jgi:hypothetical protein
MKTASAWPVLAVLAFLTLMNHADLLLPLVSSHLTPARYQYVATAVQNVGLFLSLPLLARLPKWPMVALLTITLAGSILESLRAACGLALYWGAGKAVTPRGGWTCDVAQPVALGWIVLAIAVITLWISRERR